MSLVIVHLNTQIVFLGKKRAFAKIPKVTLLQDDGINGIEWFVMIRMMMVMLFAGLNGCGQKIQVGLIIHALPQCVILNGVLNN